jgi:hypothetical protein
MRVRIALLAAAAVTLSASSPEAGSSRHTWWNTEISSIWNRSTRGYMFANPETNATFTVLINTGMYGQGNIVPWCNNDWELQNKAIKVYRMDEKGQTMDLNMFICQDYQNDRVTYTYVGYKWLNRNYCSAEPISKVVITVDVVGGVRCTKA